MKMYSFLLYRHPGLRCLLFSETLYWKKLEKQTSPNRQLIAAVAFYDMTGWKKEI